MVKIFTSAVRGTGGLAKEGGVPTLLHRAGHFGMGSLLSTQGTQMCSSKGMMEGYLQEGCTY